MMRKNRICTTLFFALLCFLANAQSHYERSIEGMPESWNKIVLPDGVFGKVTSNFSDIRIIGVNSESDTTEAPYLVKILSEVTEEAEIPFETINQTSNANGHFYTFKVATAQAFNELKLDFSESNFDWKVKLEGSQDQKEWFTVLEDYRIVAIENEQTEYRFTQLKFPKVQYDFLRIQIQNDKKPKLRSATIKERKNVEGSKRTYALQNWSVRQNEKQTLLDIQLKEKVPVSRLKVKVKETTDFYRPLSIQYLRDSVKTDKGWKYAYRTISTDVLSSIGDQEFTFFPEITNKIRLLVRNDDNEPLDIEFVELSGDTHELWTRLKPNYQYTLQYGNHKLHAPNYDIARFRDKIPAVLPSLKLGKEVWVTEAEAPIATPLFENQLWLWAILLVIIGVLGRFTLKMLSKNP